MDSPSQVLSTSITMEPSSLAASASAFGLPPSAMSSSFQRRSYAAAVAGRENLNTLSTSLASMAFQPMSFGTSYSKSKVTNLMASQSDAELTKGYQCCEQTHEGLHALLEHVEDAHPFSDPDMPNDTGFSPMTHAMDLEFEELDTGLSMIDERVPSGTGSTRSSLSPGVVPNYPLPPSTSASSSKPPTPNEQPCFLMPSLQISDVLTSPHDAQSSMNAANPLSASSSPPEGSLATPTTSAQPSPVFVAPKLGPTRGGFFGTNMPRPPAQQRRFDRAFNEVVAGKKDQMPGDRSAAPMAVAPGVLFASAVASLGIPTTPAVSGRRESEDTSYTDDASKAQLEPAMPQPSLFTSHKPWRCPNPGCNKAYRQSNGLKYHQQRG